MLGVSFQPGQQQQMGQSPNGGSRPSSGSGIQEAIKILSLRLPRVVGAQAITSMPLMNAQPNPRVDKVVNQVMSRFGGEQPPTPMLPSDSGGPNFTGDAGPNYQQQWQPETPWRNFTPRIVFDPPFGHGDLGIGLDGRPIGSFPGMIEQLPSGIEYGPPEPMPELPNFDQPIFGQRRNDTPQQQPEYYEPAPSWSDWGSFTI